MALLAPVTATNPNGDHEVQPACKDTISSISFSPNPAMKFVVAGCWDSNVYCWEMQTQMGFGGTGEISAIQTQAKASISHDGPVLCTAFNNEGNTVFSGGCDNNVKMWALGQAAVTIGQHAGPVRAMAWIQEMNVLVTGSWDKTLKYWDVRAPKEVATVTLQERVFSMDVSHPLLTVGTADRHISIFNLSNPQAEFRRIESPLKFQTRCVANFVDRKGFAVASIEGRCGIQHVLETDASKNFAFKCHRENSDIYSVNDISFHPKYGTFATAGSDGTFVFWDKDARTRLNQFKKCPMPITVAKFNHDGSIFAYATGYDWSKGVEYYTEQGASLFLHAVKDSEIKPKDKAKK